jgi:hypothetical protein
VTDDRITRWRIAEAKRAANDQRYRAMGFLLPVIELADEARNPDGTRAAGAPIVPPAKRTPK